MNQASRILIVDDNADNRELLSRLLTRQGHETFMANDGKEALDRLSKAPFDLVLLDIMMPVMGGIDCLGHIKADDSLRHIPVIVVSALDDVDNVVKCIELGAEDYLFKPVNKVILNARVSTSLEKKRLRDQEQEYLQHVRQELELGRQIQADFLPAVLPEAPGWECAVSFHPAFEVAGDFYDLFLLGENRLCCVIADVCGKGVGAALFMALVRSLMRAFAEQAVAAGENVLRAVELTNSYITRHHRQRKSYMFATLFFGALDTETGIMDYTTAGHYPPLILGQDGSISSLELCGPALGITGETTFDVKHTLVPKGSTIFAYTDGVIEAKNAAEDLFSQERLLSILQSQAPGAQAVLERIEECLRAYTGDTEQSDDITMLAVKRL
jgi:sigma-B regulation protein RsbU (phosphoserine phosphatase)